MLRRLNDVDDYRRLFAQSFPEVRHGAPITFDMFGRAIAEFEFTLVFADAPIDRFARGAHGAMTSAQKRGGALFFGRAGCVRCHAVSGPSNEMFSDFEQHVLAVPQVSPSVTNLTFDGPGRMKTSVLSRSHRTPRTGMRSARHHCATSVCSRRSVTMARS